MYSSLLKGWAADEMLRAVCWTFIHSLWQGLIFAVLAGVCLVFTKKTYPALRYNLLAAILLLFIAATGITFYFQLKENGMETAGGALLPAAWQADNMVTYLTRQFVDYCNANTSLLMLLWLTVFVAKFIKMLGGLLYIRHLRSNATASAGHYWEEKVRVLARRLHIRKAVQLLESATVKVPVVIGWLKPVIMVPAGLLTTLSQDQVEAILLHELAHIRRKDYFVNLLQSLLETLFFFNPALLWLSHLLREEREHCCDDIAITGVRSKAAYINALVSFEEYHLNVFTPAASVAFANDRHQLLNRVKRIVHNHNKNLNVMERIFLTASICILVAAAFSPLAPIRAQKHNTMQDRTASKGKTPVKARTAVIKKLPVTQPDNTKQHIIDAPLPQAVADAEAAHRKEAAQKEQEGQRILQQQAALATVREQQPAEPGQAQKAIAEREPALRQEQAGHEKQALLHEEAYKAVESRRAAAEANGTAHQRTTEGPVTIIKPVAAIKPVSSK